NRGRVGILPKAHSRARGAHPEFQASNVISRIDTAPLAALWPQKKAAAAPGGCGGVAARSARRRWGTPSRDLRKAVLLQRPRRLPPNRLTLGSQRVAYAAFGRMPADGDGLGGGAPPCAPSTQRVGLHLIQQRQCPLDGAMRVVTAG